MNPYEVGKCYFIQTLTDYFTGRVDKATARDVTLVEAAWIPETGRFADAMRTGKFSEVEPYPDAMAVIVHLDKVVASAEWSHPLPREQKKNNQ